MANSNRRSNAI